MKELGYKDQSASELRFTLVRGCLDDRRFHILQSGSLEGGFLKVEARIIGASHYISFSTKDFLLNEIFACESIETSANIAYCGPLDQIKGSVSLGLSYGLNYSFHVRTVDTTEKPYNPRNIIEAMAEVKGLGLLYEFPVIDNTPTPLTTVGVYFKNLGEKPDKEVCIVETAHSYPNENKVVLTMTELTRSH